MKYLLSVIIFIFLVGCSSSTSWAYQFLKYNDVHYIVTEEKVEIYDLGEKLGEVKYYLEEEQNSKDLSSNIYPKGTEFYEINGISSLEAIAVKDVEGEIIKLVAEGEWGK